MSNPCDFYIGGKKMKMDEFLSYVKKMPQNELNDVLGNIPSYKNIPEAPFVTDTNAWTKLGLKVALKEAVSQGVDKIAWTTGEQQNERYDLSKQVDEIQYLKNNDGTHLVRAIKDGQTIEHNPKLNDNELESMLGKDVAKRIIQDEGLDIEVSHLGDTLKAKSLRGQQLSVGGKGMKGFYGSPTEGSFGIVGNVAKSLFKQEPKTILLDREMKFSEKAAFQIIKNEYHPLEWGLFDNNRKELGRFKTNEEAYQAKLKAIDDNLKSTSTQHSITITPEMRAEVQSKGQPLFMFATRKDTRPFETINPKRATKENLQKEFPDAVVVQSESELPTSLQSEIKQQRAEGKVKGVYHNGEVYLVADNLKTIGEATGTYRHEAIGHKGVIEHLGTKLNEYTTRIIDNAKGGQFRKLQELAAKYGLPTDLNALTNTQKQLLGEEYIAYISQNKSILPKAWNDLVSFIREAIRKFGIKLEVTDTEIQALIGKVEKQQKTKNDLTNFGKSSMFSINSTQDELDTIKEKAQADGTFMKAPNGKPTNLNEKQWLQTRTKAFKEWFGDWENDPKNASKVVDENGEPLVVYHGTGTSFNEFNATKQQTTAYGYGFYFAVDENVAKGYSKDELNIKSVFLNIRNPINKKDKKYSRKELYDIINNIINLEIEKYRDEITTYKDTFISNFVNTYSMTKENAINEVASMLYDGNNNKVDQIGELSNVLGDRITAPQALLNTIGDDGILVDNYEESGLPIYISFLPNQIKSATDNVGTFNAGNNDIRFHLADDKPLRLPQTIARQTLDQMKTDTRNKVSKVAMLDNAIDFIQNSNWYKNLEDNQKARVNKTALKSLLVNSIKDTNYLEDKIEDYKQQIKDNKLTSKQVFDDIIAFLKTNQIKGKITPTEINRLIKSAAEITTKKDTSKALDDFMKLYEVIKEKALLRSDSRAKEQAEVDYVVPMVESLVESGYDLDAVLDYFETNSQKRMAEVQYHKEKSKFATEEERVEKVNKSIEKQKQDLYNATHKTFRDWLKRQRLAWFNLMTDRSYVPANLMKKTGMEHAYYQFKNTNGYGHNAKEMYNKAFDKVWKKLTVDKVQLLNDIIQKMRIISIENSTSKVIQHPDNMSKLDAQAWLDSKRAELGDKAFNDLEKRANAYFKTYKEVLDLMLENGFISYESYEAMNGLDYQPRLFIQHALNFDGDLTLEQKSYLNNVKDGLGDNPIKNLDNGSANSLIYDAQFLLSNSIATLYRNIADNNINSLLMAKEFPKAKEKYDTLLEKPTSELKAKEIEFIKYFKILKDKIRPNTIIGFNSDTNEPIYKEETPNKFVNKYYWADGVKHRFFMEENLAEEFGGKKRLFLNDNQEIIEWVRLLTGVSILKWMATGNSPTFFITNTPRDFQMNILVSQHYGSFDLFGKKIYGVPMVGTAQMTYQLFPSTYDFIKTKLGYENTDMSLFFQNGGSFEYLHKQGELAKTSVGYRYIKKPITSILGKNMQPRVERYLDNNWLVKGMTSVNEWSEIAFRIATFRRSINAQLKEWKVSHESQIGDLIDENGIVLETKKEILDNIYRKAVYDAKSVLNFSEGGRLVKDLDQFIPYTNVAVQATRSYADAMQKKPVVTTLKTFNAVAITAGGVLTIGMMLLAGDDDEPEEEKGKTTERKMIEFREGISEQTKAKYMLFPTKKRDEKGNRIAYKIAKEQLLIPYINLVEALMENRMRAKAGYKEIGWDKITTRLYRDIIEYNLSLERPTTNSVLLTPLEMTIGKVKNVPLFKAGVAAFAGYDLYRDKELDKYAKATALEGMNNENVEDFYKHFGRELGISPIRTKSAIESIVTSPETNSYLAIGYEVMDYAFTDKSMESLGKGIQEMLLKGLKNRTQVKSTEWTRTENILSDTKDEQEEAKLKEEAIRQLFKYKAQEVMEGKISEDDGLIKLQAQYGNDYNYDSYEDSYFREIEKIERKEEMTTAMEIIKREDSPKARVLMIQEIYGDINSPANAKIKQDLEDNGVLNEATLRYLEKKSKQ